MQEEQYSAVPTQQPRATPQLGSGLLREMFFLVNLEIFFALFVKRSIVFCFWAASKSLSRFIFSASLLFCLCFPAFLLLCFFSFSAFSRFCCFASLIVLLL